MPFNSDGSWTSPKTGKRYPKDTPRNQMDPADDAALGEELSGKLVDNPAGDAASGAGNALGFQPSIIDPDAPGASLDTTQADIQRNALQKEVDLLQQQAATGDGAWQQSFAEAVKRTQANASALGQSDARVDAGSALANIGNAQAATRQRAVNEEGVLRAQSKLDARGQLADILGNQAQMDLAQSAEKARIERERRAANQASIDQSLQNRKSTESASSMGMGGGGMSDGGRVPGQPQVFGDDARNDTVPAWLSPGEIVVPISKADDPDQAARFARAVAARGEAKGYAEGGGVRPAYGSEAGGEGMIAAQFFGGPFARSAMYNKLRETAGAGGGGELDLTQYNQTGQQQDTLAALFAGQALGSGPSIVPFAAGQTTNANMGAAQAAQVRGGVPAGDLLQTSSEAGVEGAADAGRMRANEQSQGQNAFAKAVRQRRAQELQASSAQQQAAFGKTLADLGLSLKSQSELRGAIGAAGQGAAAFAGAQPRSEFSQREQRDYEGERGGYTDLSQDDPEFKAHGGVVGNYAKGGSVEGKYPAMPKPQDKGDAKLNFGELTLETQADRAAREYEEETGTPMPAKRPKKPDAKESAFVRAVREGMRKAGGMVRGFSEGGGVPDAGGYTPFDPYAFDVQRAAPTGQVVYVSPTPVPGAQPINIGGAGGGSEAPTSGAGGGAPDMGAAAAGGAGGASGAVQMDRGSGGATGGPAGNQIPQHEAIQPRAERPAMAAPPMPGVTPRGAAPATTPVPPKPEAAHAPPTGKGSGRPSGASADELARKAALTQYEADNQANAAAIEQGAAEASAIESAANERKAVVARTQAKVQDAQTRYQQAVDEMSRIDTSVEPGRFWASRTTGDKVIGILGLVLGALGAGPDGINRAAVMLNDAVNRDLEAQKSEHELRLKKGGAKANAAQNFYSMAREMAGDEVAATDLANAAAMQSVVAKGKTLMAQTQDAQAKARLAGLIAAIEQGAAQRSAAAWEKAADRHLEREKMAVAAAAKGLGGEGERKALHDAEATAQDSLDLIRSIKGSLAKTQSAIPGVTAVKQNFGDEAPNIETATTQLTLKLKDMAKLGQISNTDQGLLDRLIGDPQKVWGKGSSEASKVERLNALEAIVIRSIQNQRGAAVGGRAQ